AGRGGGAGGGGWGAARSAGPATWLPPMPELSTATRLGPNACCIRRASTSGHRSSPFIVDAVPSVIESPNAITTGVVDGAFMSIASRQNHDDVEYGNAASAWSAPLRRAAGAVT